jgi:hypothetical protein
MKKLQSEKLLEKTIKRMNEDNDFEKTHKFNQIEPSVIEFDNDQYQRKSVHYVDKEM